MKAVAVLFFFLLAQSAGACETVLTQAEIAADRSRAVEFFGFESNAHLGYVVNAAGDLNGDGFDDFVLVAPQESSPESNAGTVYLVFGRNATAWASATFDFSASETPDPASWIRISGGTSGTLLGYQGIAWGDYNDDNAVDLFLSTNVNAAFVVYGSAGAWSSFNITDVESGAVPGFVIKTPNPDANFYVGNAGDMNGDGIEDMLVTVDSGTGYVVFGEPGASRNTFDLSNIDGTNGFSFSDGAPFFGIDGALGSAGDVNGDGFDDLVVGSKDAGHAYVLFAKSGQWNAFINLTADLDGTNGCDIEGTPVNGLGLTAVGASDVNADGFADLFVGSTSSGAWIVFGRAMPWPSSLYASQLDGSDGFHFASSGEKWGYSGGRAGDVNGDGIDDLIVGGPQGTSSVGTGTTGASVILFGHWNPWPAELGHADAVGNVGFQIDGPEVDSFFGCSSSGAGDVNGDGLADFVVGAHFSELYQGIKLYEGYAVLVFGVADDHCAVCSNTSDVCLLCDDGFFFNGTLCEASQTSSSSSPQPMSSSISESSTLPFSFSTQDSNDAASTPQASSLAAASASGTVVVIETGGGGGTVGEVAAEIAQLLGVDVGQISVVEITPGTFEVTVINEEVAQQLVTLIEQCMEQASSEQ